MRKKIEEAAHEDFPYGAKSSVGSGTRSMYENKKQSFMHGAKSEAAKEFHQQGMYSEQEVLHLINEAFLIGVKDWGTDSLYAWFEKNKKL